MKIANWMRGEMFALSVSAREATLATSIGAKSRATGWADASTKKVLIGSALLGIVTVVTGCSNITFASSESACSSSKAWPSKALTADDAIRVDSAQFLTADQLHRWGVLLDEHGLRATGTASHEAYIDELAERLKCAGISQISFEAVPMVRWSVESWSLAVTNGDTAGAVPVASYVPYSGVTSPQGVTAQMVYLDSKTVPTAANSAGKIVLFDVTQSSIPMAGFQSLALNTYDPNNELSPSATYARPYLAVPTSIMDQLSASGAAGAIGIIPAPYATAHGTYLPYDRKLRNAPALFVDKDVGAKLKQLALSGGTQMTLTLPARVESINTRNLVAVIPGSSDELTVINSHTDGTNGLEDNGPDAIVGMAQYLARLPKGALPRTILILLSSGHFAGGVGAQDFLQAHRSDGLLTRIASIVTLEHLGAQEWLPDSNGFLAPTGKAEFAAIFQPKIQALADLSYAALKNANAAPSIVMRPQNPKGDGIEHAVWPGEGQYFWGIAHIPTVNYISGPYYLLNWGVTTADKTDFNRMRREMIAFTQMQLDLSRVSKAELSTVSQVIVPAPHSGSNSP